MSHHPAVAGARPTGTMSRARVWLRGAMRTARSMTASRDLDSDERTCVLQTHVPVLPPMPDGNMGMVKYSGQIGLLKKVWVLCMVFWWWSL